jgi:hypothetical protein
MLPLHRVELLVCHTSSKEISFLFQDPNQVFFSASNNDSGQLLSTSLLYAAL